ncbi:MAG: hypothetical protein Q9191_006782 [Dirinaria sp. TL-2023a]
MAREAEKKSWNSQAITLPPNLPTPNTRPQSLPSTLTRAHPASSPFGTPFILVLASSLIPSSPPSTWPGSSSGLCSPSQVELMRRAGVLMERESCPCIFAASVSRELADDGAVVGGSLRVVVAVGGGDNSRRT